MASKNCWYPSHDCLTSRLTKFPLALIGVFDSGVGGLSILDEALRQLPQHDYIYLADSANAPYGERSSEWIAARSLALCTQLLNEGCDAIVVACNTATAAAIDEMRLRYNLPIIGMEPALKPAAAATKNGIIGVLATTGTLKSAQFAALLESYGRNVEVVTQACVGLVECIERGELNASNTRNLIQQYCAPLLAEGADTIVLGCTHYPFVRDVIAEIVGKEVVLIDTGAAVANQLKHRLELENMQSAQLQDALPKKPKVQFWTNSSADNAKQVISQLWGESANVLVF